MFLKEEQRNHVIQRYKKECSKPVARMHAIILRDKGWTYPDIAEALMLDLSTVRHYVEDYKKSEKIDSNYKGAPSKLNPQQTQELIKHLTEKTYLRTLDICQHVTAQYGVTYSRQGMTEWMHSHDFCYKKAKGIPAKADAEKQKAFVALYNKELKDKSSDEPVLAMDTAHSTMSTKLSYGWICKDGEKDIQTTPPKTRRNYGRYPQG
ncbi:MAG: winged helix-turn-helix domain-containing protein [Bacteroidota bacterium]